METIIVVLLVLVLVVSVFQLERFWSRRRTAVAWRQFSREIGATFQDGGFFLSHAVYAPVKKWTLHLDTFIVPSTPASLTYTRMRALYVSRDGFRFVLSRRGLIGGPSDRRIYHGLEDVELDDSELARAFVIKANDPSKVRALLASPNIRRLVQAQPLIQLQVRELILSYDIPPSREGLPVRLGELSFEELGVIRDRARLRSLRDLLSETLDQLCRIGLASEEKVLFEN